VKTNKGKARQGKAAVSAALFRLQHFQGERMDDGRRRSLFVTNPFF